MGRLPRLTDSSPTSPAIDQGRMKRFLGLLLATAATLTSACQYSAPTVEQADFSTKDSVLAIQLSTQPMGGGPFDPTLGYLVLSEASRKIQAFNSGEMFGTQPLWTRNRLFFGGPSDEFITTPQGTTRLPRQIEPHGEFARYENRSDSGFISFYNGGSNEEGYRQPVVVGNSKGNRSIDVRGAYMNMGVCNDTLYTLTDTRLAPNLTAHAINVFEENQSLNDQATQDIPLLDILVQVYPVKDPHDPKVLAAFTHDDSVGGGNREMVCMDDKIYIPFFQRDHPHARRGDGTDPKAGYAGMQEWDLIDRTRRTVPLIDED